MGLELGAWAFALVLLSLGSLLMVAVLLPLVIRRLPDDYFAASGRHRPPPPVQSGTIRLGRWLKNLVGGLFVLAGLAMLVLPGQGLLTLLAGFILMDFPGKYAIERWLAGRPNVLATLNWIRRRNGKPPFVVEAHSHSQPTAPPPCEEPQAANPHENTPD